MFRHTDIHMLPLYIYIYIYIHTYIHTYIHKYTQTYTYNLLSLECTYVKMRYIYLHKYIYIYIYVCVQTVPLTHQHICRLDVHLEQVEDCKNYLIFYVTLSTCMLDL